MSKEKYIALLNERLSILSSPDFDSRVWTDQTTETLRKLFPISHDKKAKIIRGITYNLGNIGTDKTARDKYLEKNKGRAKEYILGFIKEIEQHGIEINSSNQESHFIMLKNGLFWTIILSFIAGSFWLGYFFGLNRFDNEKLNLSAEVQKLNKIIENQKRSIDSIRTEEN